ncbi:MAG: Zn-ribbon domain-containing OB-fold protein [Acidobacteriia bacterium]|nr:Zn-ribbon domain-containing OB-fold protein [Terriglobia bacterium]
MSTLNPARVAREFPVRYRLEAARCEACGAVSFPARLVCPSCRGRKFTTLVLEPEGKVLTWTVIHIGPSSHKHDVPYALAVVELAGGVRLTCQLADVDPAKVEFGMRVRLEFRRIQGDGEAGVIAYGHKAIPA